MSAPLPKEMNFRDRLESAGVGVREKLYIQPTNGASFTSGTNFSEFHIPGSRMNTFADLEDLYIDFNLSNDNSTTFLDTAGVLNCVERIECDTSSGVRIFETRNKDIIDNLKLISGNNTLALSASGSVIMGTTPNGGSRRNISNADDKKFVLPIVNTPINTFWPMFGNDGIRLRIHWAGAKQIAIQEATNTNLADNSFTFSSVRLHYDTVKLNDQDMSELFNELDGRFVITKNAFQNQQEISTSTSIISNLGFGRSKCKAIYVCMRNTDAIAARANSAHSFDIHTLNTAELRYNGRLINESSLTFSPSTAADGSTGGAATVLAEILKQSGKSLSNSVQNMMTQATFEVAKPTIEYNATSGTFFIVFDLTSGLDTHLSESGLDTRTGTFQLNLTASSAMDHTIDVFCEYETKIVLDMRADRVFRVMS